MKNVKLLLWFVLVANIVGAVYGFVFYYGEQLHDVNALLAVFVPDCPLYALLFAITVFLLLKKKSYNLFFFLVFVGALKYGFWTMFVLTKYSEYYFTQDSLLYSILFVSHLGLFLESVLLFGKIRLKKSYLLIALLWFFLNDLVDYLLGTHPPLPSEGIQFMFKATVVMTLAFTFIAYYLLKKVQRTPVDVI